MISHAKQEPIHHFFNADQNHAFFVPKYQREYVWRREHWEALFNDIEDQANGHFLGTIICVNREQDSIAGARLELVDGQQRFTTLFLLFSAIYQRLEEAKETSTDLFLAKATLQYRLLPKKCDYWRFTPSEQSNNKKDVQAILHRLFEQEVKKPSDSKNFGNRRIGKAYKYFRERLAGFSIDDTLDYLDKALGAVLVKIEVSSYADAYVLFETINNRGIPLSPIDIIKNNLLAEVDKLNGAATAVDEAFEDWNSFVEWIPDTKQQERFLRQYYNVFRNIPEIAVAQEKRATRSNLISIFETIAKEHPSWLFNDLLRKAEAYASLISPVSSIVPWRRDVEDALLRLSRLGAAPAYALLMWILEQENRTNPEVETAILQTAVFLSKWFFWRNLTNSPSTRDLENLILSVIEELERTKQASGLFEAESVSATLGKQLIAKLPPESECTRRLHDAVYVEHYEATRFMLCAIEESSRTAENRIDLWQKNSSGKPVFSIEHILPQTPNLSSEWLEMLGESGEPSREMLALKVHKLGNLTLSGYNSKLGKMSFVQKRDRKDGKGQLIGYRNGLDLNKDVKEALEWNLKSIELRTENLAKRVVAELGVWHD